MRNAFLLIVFMLIMAGFMSCIGASPDPTVKNFITKCETGDWSGAEVLLSERGKMAFTQSKPLKDTYWPMLGLANASGISSDIVNKQLPTAIQVVSSDFSTTSAQVSIKINNTLLLGKEGAESVKSRSGLKSIDPIIKFELVQEMNRWRIERINPQVSDPIEKQKWEELAKKSPLSVTGG